MQIAVISDTHMNQPAGWFIRFYEEHLAVADLLIHCGDVTGFATWQMLMQHPNFHCARGNCDMHVQLGPQLSDFVTLDLNGFRLAACHGWGPRSSVPDRVAAHFGHDWDLICFGHTHARYFSDEHGSLLLNPGSLGETGSWAMAHIDTSGAVSCDFRVAEC
ncbi:MAG: metallophosphatase family protein [Proteobacteria bacterium]|nr:metallophosphatase family protein [Pseudomonadota bacterium]MBU1610712.1 metallophosphatase family protein [Pseudomonadota bacterium]